MQLKLEWKYNGSSRVCRRPPQSQDGSLHEALDPQDPPASPAISSVSEAYSDSPPAFRSDLRGSSQHPPSLTLRTVDELRSLFQALPTKADIVLISSLEETHRQKFQEVKKDA